MTAAGSSVSSHVGDVEEDASQLLFPKGGAHKYRLLPKLFVRLQCNLYWKQLRCYMWPMRIIIPWLLIYVSCITDLNLNIFIIRPSSSVLVKCFSHWHTCIVIIMMFGPLIKIELFVCLLRVNYKFKFTWIAVLEGLRINKLPKIVQADFDQQDFCPTSWNRP